MPNFLQLQHVRSLSMLREVQINSNVHPVVCNRSIHPHFIRAEELDLKLQELHILHCLFKHSADIYFGSIWYKVLQYPQPLIDPLSSLRRGSGTRLLTGGQLESCHPAYQKQGVLEKQLSHFQRCRNSSFVHFPVAWPSWPS